MGSTPAAPHNAADETAADAPMRPDDRELWDVAVVGAGPAGSTAALHLAARGHRVALVDRRGFPRDKTCGDGLLPDAVRCLRRAGVWADVESTAFHCPAARFYSPSRVEVAIPGDFYTIARQALDAILVRQAMRRGAVLRRGHVERLHVKDDGTVALQAAGGELRCRVAIVATGADVSLLEPLGMVRRSEPSAFAVRRYLASSASIDELVFSFDRASLPGYGWIFSLGSGVYNVGVGLFGRRRDSDRNPRQLFDTFIGEFPLARELVAGGEFLTPLRGARLRCGLAGVDPVAGNVVAVGETLGTTYPFSGEGIGKAMESGEAAAEAVHEALQDRDPAALEGYARALERLRPSYRGYHLAERWFSRPWLTDLLARRARRSAYIREAIAGIVTETVDPRVVFSLRGMLRSLWS